MSQPDWTNDPQSPRNRRDESFDDQPQKPPGMSGGMKTCLILLCVIGFCCLLCCGIVGYFGYSFVPKISQNPGEIDAARDAIAKFTVPAGLKPKQMVKIDNMMVSMTVVQYENLGHAELSLMEIRAKFGGADAQIGMRQQFEQKSGTERQPLDNSKSETKNLKIKGKEYPFTFTRGQSRGDKKPRYRISGQFDNGSGMVIINVDFDDTYKEADIVKMIESIQ